MRTSGQLESRDNVHRAAALPEFTTTGARPIIGKYPIDGIGKIHRGNQSIGFSGQDDEALSGLPQHEAGNVKIFRLFVNSTKIGNDESCVAHATKERYVTQRLYHNQIRHRLTLFRQIELEEFFHDTRVHREYQWRAFDDLSRLRHELRKEIRRRPPAPARSPKKRRG